MRYKVQILLDRFVKVLSAWEGVECITLNEAATPATLDPYFALILDVFCKPSPCGQGNIPEPDKRAILYGDDIGAFETTGNKDRFLVGDMPIRFEFKATKNIEELVTIADSKHEMLWLIKDSGTYGYYRLANGDILFSRGDWIGTVRSRLTNLTDEFWNVMRNSNQSKMEHFLSDLGAALIQGDNFFYFMSASGFIKTACLTLFCINKQFEPSHRAYYKKVTQLPILSESFAAQLETFLRNDSEASMEHRYSIAQIIARGIVTL